MEKPLEELKEDLLREYDADLLLEILQISADDLLDRFEDRIITNWELLDDE